MTLVTIIMVVAFILRLVTLFYSIKNEKRLKQEGAVEYGQVNSTVMAILHTLIYLLSLTWAIARKTPFDTVTLIGVVLWIFSFLVLITVIYQIKDFWTVKLLIAKGHKLNTSFLFKYIRHPNYFLNIIPELIAVTLICKSWYIFAVSFPLYLVTLVVRIMEEEKVMKQNSIWHG